jgi:hypothetical protein
MLFSMLLLVGCQVQLTKLFPVSLAFISLHGAIAIRRFVSQLVQVLLSLSVLSFVSMKIGERASSFEIATFQHPNTFRRFRVAIRLLTCRIATTVHLESLYANWIPPATPKQNAKSTSRAQSRRNHESLQRDYDYRKTLSKSPSSSSHALSTTLPWTIKLSLAVLWVSLYTFT